MPPAAPACPLSRREVIDRYFLEHRAKLLDLAAFLDRIDRASPGRDDPETPVDHRLASLIDAIALLTDDAPDRARRILELFSDPTATPVAAADTQGATGAHPGYRPRSHEAGDDEDLNLL